MIKVQFNTIFILTSLLVSFNSSIAQNFFTVTNLLPEKRTDALIVISRKEVEKKLGKTAQPFLIIKDEKGNSVTVQQDDLDDDGKWDEAVFLYGFEPKQKVFFTIGVSDNNSSANIISRAHTRMKHKNTDDSFGADILNDTMPFNNPPTDFSKHRLPFYLTEGPAWENDKVAFRQYFDLRNTRDIYGKKVSGMVMDTVGANYKNSYHRLSDWGMDILHVVKSLGAGSIAIATQDENEKDTLIRLAGKAIQQQVFKKISDGPVRAMFRMSYRWQINKKPVTVIEETSIWGGQYFYETKVTVAGVPANAQLVTGIGDFYENRVDSFTTSGVAVLLSHGKQSENKDELGMAIAVPKRSFAGFKEAPKSGSNITETHLVAQRIKNGKPLRYRFYSCWVQTNDQFASDDYFKRFMQQQAAAFESELTIRW